MADKQATPDAVVKIRTSDFQRSVAVGAFGRSFDMAVDDCGPTRGIKAVWRKETGSFACVPGKTVSR